MSLQWCTVKDFFRHPLDYLLFLAGSCCGFILFFSDYSRLRIATYRSTKQSPLREKVIQNIAIIIPARNEEESIVATLQHIEENASNPQNLHVVVSDGGSEDNTIEVCKTAARRLKKLGSIRVISAYSATGRGIVINAGIRASETAATPRPTRRDQISESSNPRRSSSSSPPGKDKAHNVLVEEKNCVEFVEHHARDTLPEHSEPDAFLFLHADTRVEKGFDVRICEELSRPDNVMGAFTFEVDREQLSAPLPGLELVELGVRRRNSMYWLCYGDQGYFIRREMLNILGGIPNVVFMEDFDFIHHARRYAFEHNMKIHIDPMRIYTSPRRFERNGFSQNTIFNQWVVFAYTVLNYTPQEIYDVYYQHKGE